MASARPKSPGPSPLLPSGGPGIGAASSEAEHARRGGQYGQTGLHRSTPFSNIG